MPVLKRLLAATDLSAPARHAAERAALIAGETGAGLDLVHVLSLAPLEQLRRLLGDIAPDADRELLDAARREVRDIAAHLLHRRGIAAGVQVLTGPLLPALASQADAAISDLVVLGARGSSFMRHALLGSTAENMVSKACRPTLVVKQAAHEGYRNVLVPVDFSPGSAGALALARAVAPQARIVLLHVLELPFLGKLKFAGVDDEALIRYQVSARDEARGRLQALADGTGLPAGQVVGLLTEGDPAQHIVEQEQEQDCDLIVVGKHGSGMLEELLLGSVSRHVLGESQCDVLISA